MQKSLYYLNICWQVLWSWFVQEPGVTNARQIEPDRKSQQLFCGQIFWAPPYLSLLCWPTNPLLSLDQVGIYLFLCLSFSLTISVSFCLAVCLFLSFFSLDTPFCVFLPRFNLFLSLFCLCYYLNHLLYLALFRRD